MFYSPRLPFATSAYNMYSLRCAPSCILSSHHEALDGKMAMCVRLVLTDCCGSVLVCALMVCVLWQQLWGAFIRHALTERAVINVPDEMADIPALMPCGPEASG